MQFAQVFSLSVNILLKLSTFKSNNDFSCLTPDKQIFSRGSRTNNYCTNVRSSFKRTNDTSSFKSTHCNLQLRV